MKLYKAVFDFIQWIVLARDEEHAIELVKKERYYLELRRINPRDSDKVRIYFLSDASVTYIDTIIS